LRTSKEVRTVCKVLHPRPADVLDDGDDLGPLGGRFVGEVLVGIIDADHPDSG
jgi:hypothetical protein